MTAVLNKAQRQSNLTSEKCQIITELVAYLYTSNVVTACESMEHGFVSLKC